MPSKRKTAARSRKTKKKTTPSRIRMFFESVRQQHGGAFAKVTMFLVLVTMPVLIRQVLEDITPARESCLSTRMTLQLI